MLLLSLRLLSHVYFIPSTYSVPANVNKMLTFVLSPKNEKKKIYFLKSEFRYVIRIFSFNICYEFFLLLFFYATSVYFLPLFFHKQFTFTFFPFFCYKICFICYSKIILFHFSLIINTLHNTEHLSLP